MENLLRVIVLSVIQGLTEFLPVSSSGHLIIARELFGWEFDDELTLDVALHLGTTVAVLAFFWREWLSMLRGALRWAADRGAGPPTGAVYDQRLLLLLAIGSLPAAVAGLALSGVEDEIRSPIVAGAMLLVFGAVLYLAERAGRADRRLETAGLRDAVGVGLAQAVALVPGVSRAGVTISAGLARGLTRQEAARFSFLLSTPVIAGAGALQVGRALAEGIAADDLGTMAAGAAVAAVSGWLAIRYLLRFLQASTFLPFVLYRGGLGVFALVYFAF